VRDHPLLTRRQMEIYWSRSRSTIRAMIQGLVRRGLLRRYNARRAEVNIRAMYALSEKGAEALMDAGTTPARLAWLLVVSECVFKTRSFLIRLSRPAPGWDWRLGNWDVEVALPFHLSSPGAERAIQVAVHGAARLARADGCWTTLVVEFDTRRAPVHAERERLMHWVEAQADSRFIGKARAEEFPILVVIAADEFRLQDYYGYLRAAAMARRLPMPHAYLATAERAAAVRENPAAPVWFSTRAGRGSVPLLSDIPGNAPPCPTEVEWTRLPLTRRVHRDIAKDSNITVAPLAETDSPSFSLIGLGSLALSLTPQDKQVLNEIARHPLLDAESWSVLLQQSRWRVEKSLARLGHWKLIESRRAPTAENQNGPGETNHPQPAVKPDAARYVLSEGGLRYLAAVAGFGAATQAYAYARGWGRGFESLAQHWEHTRAENALFLQFARIAQARGDAFAWLSELESRLYFEYGHMGGQRRQSFLPDGRGTYTGAGARYEFAVEIDRTRSAASKFRRKLATYYAVIQANILRDEAAGLLRVLVVTLSWERADTLRRIAHALAVELNMARAPLPLFITTFDMLRVKCVNDPIWLGVDARNDARVRVLDLPKTYCFECFIPPLPAPRPVPPGPLREIVQSFTPIH
jgi:predicted transcriptional regulator